VVGFDDILASQWSAPALTTVHQPFSQIGVMAVGTVTDLIAGKPVTSHRLELATELIVRESTCPPKELA
jgi:DNA-binding LacI/PurR family transcriptional regulator